ncbi:hypothetical protein BDV10DRAFT_145581 [Aspergillus recurvatus]
MPPKPGLSRHQKDDVIHFINARPASETERLSIKRMVRAHVGKWISSQTKDRAAGSAVVPVDPSPVTSAGPDAAFENDSVGPCLPSTDASPSSSSPSWQSSPESCNSCSSQPALIHSGPSHLQAETLTVFPRTPGHSKTDICDCYDGQERCRCGLSELGSLSCPGEYIEAIGAGCLDPFRVYASQYEPELIRASEEYCLSCLWPGLTPGPSGTNMKSWFPMSLSDPTLYTAFLFGSLSHMRVQALNGWIPRRMFHARRHRMLESVEMETIRLVSREINNPSRAFCDAVIWSVVCMAHNKAEGDLTDHPPSPFTAPMQRLQWLGVYGSLRPNLVHIGGLIQMVNLRGGIDEIQLPGLAAVISFSDVVTSTTFLGRPVFPFVPLQSNRKGKTMQDLLEYSNAEVDQYHTRLQPLGLPRVLAELICAMNAYTALVDSYPRGHMSSDPCLLADQRNIIHTSMQPQLNPQDIIYEAFRLATLIYSVGVILPLPAQSTPLVSLAELLYNALLPSFSDSSLRHPWDSPHAQVVLL